MKLAAGKYMCRIPFTGIATVEKTLRHVRDMFDLLDTQHKNNRCLLYTSVPSKYYSLALSLDHTLSNNRKQHLIEINYSDRDLQIRGKRSNNV